MDTHMTDANGNILTLEDVSMHYPDAEGGEPLKVLDAVDMQLERGASAAIIGPSGSGKSTLLNVIGALDRPTGGRIVFDGRDLASLDERALAEFRNCEVGFIFQEHHLLPQCTVTENVLVPTLAQRGRAGDDAAARAQRLLERVGLADRAGHRPGELSGGQRQRVAVVRALINEPKLLLADEPTGSLDHATAMQLAELLIELNREEGVTLIVVTHARELAGMMGRSFELRDGRLHE